MAIIPPPLSFPQPYFLLRYFLDWLLFFKSHKPQILSGPFGRPESKKRSVWFPRRLLGSANPMWKREKVNKRLRVFQPLVGILPFPDFVYQIIRADERIPCILCSVIQNLHVRPNKKPSKFLCHFSRNLKLTDQSFSANFSK